MQPLVQLTSFNSLCGELNLQLLETAEPWESVSCEFSDRIVLEIPKIENMLNNEKPLISLSNKINDFFTLKCFSYNSLIFLLIIINDYMFLQRRINVDMSLSARKWTMKIYKLVDKTKSRSKSLSCSVVGSHYS